MTRTLGIALILCLATSARGECLETLCGNDTDCFCHGVGDDRRCWTTQTDCEVDGSCCKALGTCQGMKQDACTAATVAAHRAVQDAGSDVPTADPCKDYDLDAGPLLVTDVDGGPPEPAVICMGQRAPEHGVFMTTARAARLHGELESTKAQVVDLKSIIAAGPTASIPGSVYLVGCLVTAAASVLLTYELHKK